MSNFYNCKINLNKDSNIQIEEGTVATSYEPYIKGYTTFENISENDVTDLRHLVSLTGFNCQSMMEQSFDSLLRGNL